MKKYLQLLITMTFVGQACMHADGIKFNLDNATETLAAIYNPIKAIQINEISDTWLQNFETFITALTANAINKSKDLVGKQDMSLILTATSIQDISSEIISLYKSIKANFNALSTNKSLRNTFENTISTLSSRLRYEAPKINRTYMTPSKKLAQKILLQTIGFLINPVLYDIEQDLQLLDPSHFA